MGCLEYDLGDRNAAESTRRIAFKIGIDIGHPGIIGWAYEMQAWVALTTGENRGLIVDLSSMELSATCVAWKCLRAFVRPTPHYDRRMTSDRRDWHELDVHDWRERIVSGDATVENGVRASLQRIDELDRELNAFSAVFREAALARARALDALDPDERGPLHGVPIGIKEEIDVAGCVTTFGTSANRAPASTDAAVVRRLREAGAIIIGTTRMPEFGMWPFTESSSYGITRNPIDPAYTPGGSSGGTAVATASGMVPAAIGSDSGGSIRIPAARCGLVGLKPQRGRVSPAPYPHLWWALGTIGPLTRTIRDCALLYDVIAGSAPSDLFTTEPIRPLVAALDDRRRLRIGRSTAATGTPRLHPHPEHVAAVDRVADLLGRAGHCVVEHRPKHSDPTTAFLPQFFAGIRSEADAVEDFAALEQRTRTMYRMGSWVTDRVRDKAITRGQRIAAQADRVFDDVDALLTPTVADRPPAAGVLTGKGAIRALLASRPSIAYTSIWNVTGHPAASVPVGLGTDGLPISVQIIGPHNGEARLLSLATEIEAALA